MKKSESQLIIIIYGSNYNCGREMAVCTRPHVLETILSIAPVLEFNLHLEQFKMSVN